MSFCTQGTSVSGAAAFYKYRLVTGATGALTGSSLASLLTMLSRWMLLATFEIPRELARWEVAVTLTFDLHEDIKLGINRRVAAPTYLYSSSTMLVGSACSMASAKNSSSGGMNSLRGGTTTRLLGERGGGGGGGREPRPAARRH
ncbi:hypothetical protein EYF80_022242 [Liparis tanakae]|uniref:Uncharacterized protein n=1 Tax=Liparis tanakae TaxID=230148 RepID=A0A4Z2HP00_9TELE|nr:hypothetical protein EYF80_022242 [Liparis tanakae]